MNKYKFISCKEKSFLLLRLVYDDLLFSIDFEDWII